MNYTIINRTPNFRPNHIQRVNEEKVGIASITRDIYKDLLDVFSLLHERLRSYSDKVDFSRVLGNVLGIIKERKTELARIKKMEDMKNSAGFTLISLIIIFGIIGLSFITFLLIKGILY